MIEIRNMSKWYGDFQVLKDINEEVKEGQTVVVCGPSGSGKSTLLGVSTVLNPSKRVKLPWMGCL